MLFEDELEQDKTPIEESTSNIDESIEEGDSTADDLEGLTTKLESYLANWKRAEADLVNYRKKVEQEREDVTKFANVSLVSSLLGVLDDFERAIDTIDSSAVDTNWIEGLELVYKKLLSTLESQGLILILTLGEKFDPTVHEAAMQVDGEEGVVMGELQKGYRFRGKVIRPAMVKVGKGYVFSEEALE